MLIKPDMIPAFIDKEVTSVFSDYGSMDVEAVIGYQIAKSLKEISECLRSEYGKVESQNSNSRSD